MDEQAAIAALIRWLETRVVPDRRPLTTLTYAQSLDGSLAGPSGESLALSGPSSLRMTHALRAWHQAILVGIGTVLADDPSLTVRHAAGDHPRPVVLDSDLRIPAAARLLQLGTRPVLFCQQRASPSRAAELEAVGATVVRLEDDSASLNLPSVLGHLRAMGIERLMVEGGARVLRSFFEQKLGDHLIVTVAPRLVGGLPLSPPEVRLGFETYPQLDAPHWQVLGDDAVCWGMLEAADL